MTAPAPRNHPAENAHPAPTPAPVAVPEGGWRDGDWLVVDDGNVWRASEGGDFRNEHGRPVIDGVVDYVLREGSVVYVHAPREDARPEPEWESVPPGTAMSPMDVRDHRPEPVSVAEALKDFPGAEPTGCCHTPGGRGLDRAGCHRCFVEGWRSELVAAPLPTRDTFPHLADHIRDARMHECEHYVPALDGREKCCAPCLRDRLLPHLVPADDEDTVRVRRVALIELNAAVMDRKRDLVDAIEEFNDEVRS